MSDYIVAARTTFMMANAALREFHEQRNAIYNEVFNEVFKEAAAVVGTPRWKQVREQAKDAARVWEMNQFVRRSQLQTNAFYSKRELRAAVQVAKLAQYTPSIIIEIECLLFNLSRMF